MPKSSELFFKYLGPKISLKNGSVLKTNLLMIDFKNYPIHYSVYQFNLNADIQRFVLSTEPFLRDICGLRYLKKKSALLVISRNFLHGCKWSHCRTLFNQILPHFRRDNARSLCEGCLEDSPTPISFNFKPYTIFRLEFLAN